MVTLKQIGFKKSLLLLVPALVGCRDQQSNSQGHLKRYLSCKVNDGLAVAVVKNMNSSEPGYRKIQISDFVRLVPVIDRYRVLYAYKGTDRFCAKVVIERFSADDYAAYKNPIIDEGPAEDVYAGEKRGRKIVDNIFWGGKNFNGLDVYVSEKKAIGDGLFVGVYTLFNDKDSVVVTISLVNAGKDGGNYKSIDDYYLLRDDVINGFAACMKDSIQKSY